MYKSTPHFQGQKSDFSSFLVKEIVNKLVIFLPTALDHEAVEVCDLLVKILWKLLGNLHLLSKSKVLLLYEPCAPAFGSQESDYLQFSSHCLHLDDCHVAVTM